ncbi:peptidoglycan recognition protein family protein [Marinisporobacter balticus]|uniref:N-acetylmuramoyl-L-alanine amidase n=1 Tax=Marinisporobacter balticus TaxID=2018667 RepID=A0A4V2SCF3_9FIRM|nr:peptidoglycan recognition family protein [Marinisporobacter balticus]TCO79140.1 N-acetylmuramoyl-L-alanine amidase [Marinisporobacter balticus]
MRRFKQYTVQEYLKYLRSLKLSRKITEVHLHHTWKPTKKGYISAKNKEKVIWGMWQYHTKTLKWSDIGQHISLAPDGTVWDGRPVNNIPASIKDHNSYGIAIEMIGDFDTGREKLEGVQLETVVKLIKGLFDIFKTERLIFHREYANKTCPGTSVKKEMIVEMINNSEKKKDWRVESGEKSLKELVQKGVVNSPNYWKNKLTEPIEVWAVLNMINNITK